MNHHDLPPRGRRAIDRGGYLLALLFTATLAVGAVVMTAWDVGAASSESGSVLVQITPCRITDTRPSTQVGSRSTPLNRRDTHLVAVHGSNGECEIPADAVGLSLNVTTLNATHQTYITIWGGGQQPLASSLNPAPGQPPTPNAVVTPLDEAGAFRMYNHNGAVDAVVDINGYYRAPAAATAEGVTALIEQHAADLVAQQSAISSLQSDVTALMADRDADRQRISDLEDAPRPTVLTDYESLMTISTAMEEVVGVSFTAPASGRLVVTANGWPNGFDASSSVVCSLTTLPGFDNDHLAVFEPAFFDQNAVLTGHRVIDVEAGETLSVRWRCFASDEGTRMSDSTMSAVFFPTGPTS
ncbi:MAG: hypothetical protein AAFY28_10135 [Actinomycetota bacterium]